MIDLFFMGIDPGKTGAVAVLNEKGKPVFYEIFDEGIPLISIQLRKACDFGEIHLAIIEKVSAMPKQGVTSMFNFGMNFGALQMALSILCIPYELVTPMTWMKKTFDSGSGGKRIKHDKEKSLDLARRKYPELQNALRYKYSNGLADALHIAEYARKISFERHNF